MALVSISLEELEDYISTLPNNTKDTPYELNITNLNSWKDMLYTLKAYDGKYYALNEQPGSVKFTSGHSVEDTVHNVVSVQGDFSSVTDANEMFYYWVNLKNVDADFSSVQNANYMFFACEDININVDKFGSVIDATGMFSSISKVSLSNLDLSCLGNIENADEMFMNTKITHEILLPNSVKTMTNCFYNAKFNKAPVLPDSVIDMGGCFRGCTSLVTAPVIPNSVIDMQYCFRDCTSLVTAPVLPDSVIDMGGCFSGCTSLVYAPVIPNSVTNMGLCFDSCTSLINAPEIPDSVTNINFCFYRCTSLVNTPVIPNSITYMQYCFSGCTSLVTAPVIPNSVIDMQYCFRDCTSLVTAPVIPNSVIDMQFCFSGCTSLVNAPVIPNSVTYMESCFYGCSLLEEVTFENMSRLNNAKSCFTNCNNLSKIYGWNISSDVIKSNPDNFTDMLKNTSPDLVIKLSWNHEETDKFKLYKFQINDTETKISKYSLEKVDGEYPEPAILSVSSHLNDIIEFGGISDEILVAKNIPDEIAEKLRKFRYSCDYTGLNPEGRNFVVWAGKGSTIKENISKSDSVPIGTIISYVGSLDKLPKSWKACNGEIVYKKNYPELYNILPKQYIIDADTFRLPDLTDRVVQGANGNLGEMIEAGLPNIIGRLGAPLNEGGNGSTEIFGAYSGSYKAGNSDGNSGANRQRNGVQIFNASNGETKTDGTLKTSDEHHVYGASDTVQPPAVAFYYIIKVTD